jgi:hypothetical protein
LICPFKRLSRADLGEGSACYAKSIEDTRVNPENFRFIRGDRNRRDQRLLSTVFVAAEEWIAVATGSGGA